MVTSQDIDFGASFIQLKYPQELYKSELAAHSSTVDEYQKDIQKQLDESIERHKADLSLYSQQPFLTFSIRLKLLDFLLKMSVRLKIIPFVFYRAVKIFDRYCSKRVALLDQVQLIITTCLWIAAKVQGGNNHFANMNNLKTKFRIRTIGDIGYGSGGKYLGPTERFRAPKLNELVKLCGARCNYDTSMFIQMERHILETLQWSVTEPSIEEFILNSNEFYILSQNELFKAKEYLSYISLNSFELIDRSISDIGQVIMDIIDEAFCLKISDRSCQLKSTSQLDSETHKFIKRHIIQAVLNSSDYIISLFGSFGPQNLRTALKETYSYPQSRERKIQFHTLPLQKFEQFSTLSSYPNTSYPSNLSSQIRNSPIYGTSDYQFGDFKINSSQASLTSTASTNLDLFESLPAKNGCSTPSSISESPDIKYMSNFTKFQLINKVHNT